VCRRRGQKSCRRHAGEPADHALGRSRGGFGSKFHLVTDGHGTPLAAEVTAGQVHESTRLESVMDRVAVPQPIGRPRTRPKRLAGDKAYRGRRIRDWLWKYGIKRVIPSAENDRTRHDGRVKFDNLAYRRRSIIENCVGWLKECRRIATRFEKLAVNYLGMLKLAMIERNLRLI
jgi:transposase